MVASSYSLAEEALLRHPDESSRRAFLGSLLLLSSAFLNEAVFAQAAAWLAAVDPFQKFVHDVLDFTKYIIDLRGQRARDRIAQSVPNLVKSMHQVAANKIALAQKIEGVMSGRDPDSTGDLGSLTSALGDSVRKLVQSIRDVDASWVVRHSDLTREIDKMEFEKSSVSKTAFENFGNGPPHMAKADALKFAARLRELASELDRAAHQIAANFHST